MKRRLLGSVLVMSIVLGAAPTRAQLNGENLLGDTGVRSGTQPAPGYYAGFLYYRYDTDVIRNASGEQITLDPTGAGSQTISAFCPLFIYVSPYRLLGANYGVMAVMPFGNGVLEAPGFGFTAIVAALLGRLQPFGVLLASFGFAALLVGGDSMQRVAKIESSTVFVIEGLILLFLLAGRLIGREQTQMG